MLNLQIGWLEVGFVLSLLLVYFYFRWMSAYTYWNKRNVPSLAPKFPFGNAKDVLLFKKNFQDFWLGIYKEMGDRPFCGVYLVRKPVLVIKDPELIKIVLVKDFGYFTDHGMFASVPEHEPLINNIFHMEGDGWKMMRSKLSPGFSAGKLKAMFPLMVTCAQQLKVVLHNTENGTGTFEAKDLTTRFAVGIILNCVFGLHSTAVQDPECRFFKIAKKIFERTLKRLVSNVLLSQAPKVYSRLKLHFVNYDALQYFADTVKLTMQEREKSQVTRNDFVDILIRLKNDLTIEDEDTVKDKPFTCDVKGIEKSAVDMSMDYLLAQAMVFFFAGYETTASTLTFCLYELSKRPDMQRKIQEEVDTALQRHGGEFTYQMLQELPYIDNVLNETLRRYGALSVLDRICVKSYNIPGTNINIEKGCKIIIPSYAIHQDPQYYPDPEKFDPDRFLEENVSSRPAYTFLPFGEGPRLCIGMRFARIEMKLALCTIFSEFNCKLNQRTAVPLTVACGEIVTTTYDNVFVDLTCRIRNP